MLLAGQGWLNILTHGGQPPTMKNYPAPNNSGDPMEKGSRQVLSMCTFSSWQQGFYLCPSLHCPDTHQGSHSRRQGLASSAYQGPLVMASAPTHCKEWGSGAAGIQYPAPHLTSHLMSLGPASSSVKWGHLLHRAVVRHRVNRSGVFTAVLGTQQVLSQEQPLV